MANGRENKVQHISDELGDVSEGKLGCAVDVNEDDGGGLANESVEVGDSGRDDVGHISDDRGKGIGSAVVGDNIVCSIGATFQQMAKVIVNKKKRTELSHNRDQADLELNEDGSKALNIVTLLEAGHRGHRGCRRRGSGGHGWNGRCRHGSSGNTNIGRRGRGGSRNKSPKGEGGEGGD